jgi:hypothetical protein
VLATRCAPDGMKQIVSGGIETVDNQTIQQVHLALAQRRSQLVSLKGDKNWPLKGKLEDEIRKLEEYLENAQGANGALRKTGGTIEKARTAVTNAIRRACDKICQVHPEMAAHLDRSIQTGSVLIYLPQELPDWEF